MGMAPEGTGRHPRTNGMAPVAAARSRGRRDHSRRRAAARLSAAVPRNFPSIRSGTALEVAEIAWIAEGVSRETALSIPSVLACRNLIVGTVMQLALYRYRGGERLDPDYLIDEAGPVDDAPRHDRRHRRRSRFLRPRLLARAGP